MADAKVKAVLLGVLYVLALFGLFVLTGCGSPTTPSVPCYVTISAGCDVNGCWRLSQPCRAVARGE